MSDISFFPPPPDPDSNAIGNFTIWQSPVGTISPLDWRKTVISQYANSQRLLTLIENFWGYIDQSQNIDNFFSLVWNIDTAVGYGLDVWGRIVGVGRVLQLPTPNYFGFEEATDAFPFNDSPFFDGNALTANYSLPDPLYRKVILAKAFANISDGTIGSINQLLINLFEKPGEPFGGPTFGFEEAGDAEPFNQAPFFGGGAYGNVYVADDGKMTMRYVFGYPPTELDIAIMQQSGVIPRPVGVSATIEAPA